MKKIKQAIIVGIFMLSFLVSQMALASSALAQCTGDFDPNDPYGIKCGEGTGLSNRDPRAVTASIIQVALGILGILVTILILYAGFKWMTAGGNEENAKSARSILMSAVIGLIIILSAFAISTFVLNQLSTAINTP